MESKEISFENLPKAVAFLSDQIAEIKQIVKNQNSISEPEKEFRLILRLPQELSERQSQQSIRWFASAKFRAIKMVRKLYF